MLNEDNLKDLTDREIKTMEIALTAKAMGTTITLNEFIDIALAQGLTKETIRTELMKDLAEGGRIFGAFRNAVKSTVNGSVNRFRDIGEFSELGDRKSTRLNSSHIPLSRMPSSA